MLRARSTLLALVVTVSLVAVSSAQFPQPQPRPAVLPTPLAVVLLPGIDDPNIVAELKLSAEQVKTLVAHRQKGWDEVYTTSPKELAANAAARTDATDALLKKTLTKEQYQRAVQLGAQNVMGTRVQTRVSITTLERYPELATAFKLTDEQKKELAADTTPLGGFPGVRAITVKSEQIAAAKEFLGPVFDKGWNTTLDPRLGSGFDPRFGSSIDPRQPREFSLLASTDVRTEVKVTEDQLKALAPVQEKWTKLALERFTDLSPKEADTQALALNAETEKLLAATLEAKQAARLETNCLSGCRIGEHTSEQSLQA